MAFQPIGDAEVQPGAIVSSSLITRLRDNAAAALLGLTTRTAGDIPLVSFASGNITGSSAFPGAYTFSATSGFSGTYRFVLTLTLANAVIQRNGIAITPVYTSTTTVDVAGWSRGDLIEIISQNNVGSTGRLVGSITADAAFGLSGIETNTAGVDP